MHHPEEKITQLDRSPPTTCGNLCQTVIATLEIEALNQQSSSEINRRMAK
jgi:hypothetical protein